MEMAIKINRRQVVIRQPDGRQAGPENMEPKNFYTISELAKVLGISRQSVLKRVGNGSIKGRKMGRDYIIFKKDINLKKIELILKK